MTQQPGQQQNQPDSLAPRETDALKEALSQLARRVRYLETLPFSGGGDERSEYAKLWQGSTQSIPNATDTILEFNNAEKTHAGYPDPTLPRTYLTVPSGLAGIHTVSAGVVFEGQPQGQRRLWITVGEEDVLVAMQVDAAADYFDTELNVSAPAYLYAGYFVYSWVYQNTGGNLLVGKLE